MAKELLHVEIFKNENVKAGDYQLGIQEAFIGTGLGNFHLLETDKQILDVANKEQWKDGSTAVICLIVGTTLFTANIGDSEAILISEEYLSM